MKESRRQFDVVPFAEALKNAREVDGKKLVEKREGKKLIEKVTK